MYHPDLGGDAEKMRLINEAYNTLKNPEMRAQYDAEMQSSCYQGGERRSEGSRVEPEDTTIEHEHDYSSQFVVNPWTRFGARIIDWIIWGFALGFALAILEPKWIYWMTNKENMLIANWVGIASWIPVEALFISRFGTTPGKWLLSISVHKLDNQPISFAEAWKRSVWAFANGFALGIPIIYFFALYSSYTYLKKSGKTSWDQTLGFWVKQKKPGALQSFVAIAIICSFFLLFLWQPNNQTTAITTSNGQTTALTTFTPDDNAFTAGFPGKPERTSEVVNTGLGKMEYISYTVDKGNSAFMVSYGDYPKDFIKGNDPNVLLDNAVKGTVESTQGQLVSKVSVIKLGCPSREIIIDVWPDMVIEGRLLLKENRLYVIYATTTYDQRNSSSVQEFLNSFRFND